MNISFGLSTSEIEKAISQVKEYKSSIETKALLLVRKLTEQGVSLAQLNASFMNAYDSGELVNGIISKYEGKIGIISSTAGHSVYVEFGTGIEGMQSPHVAILGFNPAYGSGPNIIQTQDGRIGWFYPLDDGSYRFTEGMPSRPYMYETAKMLAKFVVPIAKGVFK